MKSFLVRLFKINRFEFKGIINPTFQPIFAVMENISGISILTLVAYIVLAPIAYKLVKPNFTSEALINVEPKQPRILYQTDPSKYLHSYEDWLRTQVSIITSYPLIEKAIEEYEILGYKWRLPKESKKSAMDRLIAKIKVTNKRETQIISISMESSRPEGAAEIVNAIVKVYANYELSNQKIVDNFKLKFLLDKKLKTEDDIILLSKELEDLSRDYGTAITEEKNLYIYIEELSDLKKSYNKLLVNRIQAQNKIRQLKSKEEILKKIDVEGLVDDSLKTNPSVMENSKNLASSEYEIRSKISGLAEENFEKIFLENKIKNIRNYSEEFIKEVKREQYRVTRNKLLADNSLEILNTEIEMKTLRNSETELNIELEKARLQLLEYSTIVARASTKKVEIDRLRERIGVIASRIDEVEVELAIPGRVQVVSWALPPEVDLGAKKRLMLILAFVLSFAIGTMTFIILDFFDPTIKKQSDIKKILGFAPGGYLIDLINDSWITNSNSYLMFKDFKNSFFYKEIKEIGGKVDRENKEYKTNVFTVIGTASGSGVTTLTLNLLAYLDAPPERKVYLDMNYINPVRNCIPEIESELVKGKGYRILEEPNFPFKIFSGTKEEVYEEANRSNSYLLNWINSIKNENELVFIDCPPLLHFSEAMGFIKLSDVVILVVQAHETSWDELKRAVEILDNAKVKVVSVILNRVRPFKGGYLSKLISDYYNNSLGKKDG